MPSALAAPLDPATLGAGVTLAGRSIDRFARAHDASHYLLVPQTVATPSDVAGVARILAAASAASLPVTFRSGGTSLSGQGVTDGVLVDTRHAFRRIEVGEAGRTVRAQPGATIRQVNAHLARHGRRLGPDPASEIACTVGGVVANNSSGMACGITQNTYRTLRALTVVLPSGTVLDSRAPDAPQRLLAEEPALHEGLLRLRDRLRSSPAAVERVRHLFSMKNTMGYGVNALLDFDEPLDILVHLLVGSEGTLGFVAEAEFDTIEVLPHVATGLLVFPTLSAATAALPALVETGMATIELMDAASLRVAQRATDAPAAIAGLRIDEHAALLVEFHGRSADELAAARDGAAGVLASLPLTAAPALTTDPAERAALWHVRKGLYTAVAGARPSGTTALLEDVVVPVDRLLPTCERLIELFDEHGYEGSVIFGHAKDGNIHFLLGERFDDAASLARYERFTEDMVELVLTQGGSLKAEHGTGRIMAPFVRRQYGDELYAIMREIKRLFDPAGVLNPGVVLSDEPRSYLDDLKLVPTVEAEVDRCVECGYCEPTCPSKDLTLTPRQRIALRRDIAHAEAAGDAELARALREDYDYDGVDTCAVDGLCAIACPVDINTGDLVRRLRAENRNPVLDAGWSAAGKVWGVVSSGGGVALSIAKALPAPLVAGVTGLGRAVLGAETVPRYDGRLPGGGPARRRLAATPGKPEAVLFAACVGEMFGPEEDGIGASAALLRLAERAGVGIVVPESLASLCCGTPWKSKGYLDGHHAMADRAIPDLLAASDGGRLPIVSDAASCTEGLEALRRAAGELGTALRFVDATTFARESLLPRLPEPARVGRVVVHRTCSTAALGADADLAELAAFAADEVVQPLEWGCCAFAGDRGMLHPELTASATAREAAEVAGIDADAHVSANRTCEIGMTRATGRAYRHVLELVEAVTRLA